MFNKKYFEKKNQLGFQKNFKSYKNISYNILLILFSPKI